MEFVPEAFNKSLQEIRIKFPLIKEVIYTKKAEDTLDLVDRITDLDENDLARFASSLKSDELDLPLVAFRTELDNGQAEKLDSIMKIRFRKKLFVLNWLILQNNFRNEKLITSMDKLCEVMKDKYPEEYAGTILARIKNWGDRPVQKVLELHKKEKVALSEFFEKYQILHKSTFSYEFYVEYFKNAREDEINSNWSFFVLAANSYVIKESAAVINRYLELYDPRKYANDLTSVITENHSGDFGGSEFWSLISEGSKKKYAQWLKMKTMEEHFGEDNKKFVFWINYLEKFTKIEKVPGSTIIFIYFDTCVVVDTGGDEQSAYLYYKESFDLEYENFIETDKTHWRIFKENVIGARESIIEEKRSDIYKLNYEFVGRLYLKEILETEALKKKKRK